MKNRSLGKRLIERSKSKTGRIIILTGARQTGKTTLAKKIMEGYTYVSLEDPVMRDTYRNLSAEHIFSLYPSAIFDEVQKLPSLIESIKAVYDQYPESKYLLSGSSQLLLLEKVKESLAGRSNIFELFPLTLPELRTQSWEQEIKPSVFLQELKNEKPDYLPSFNLDKERIQKAKALEIAISTGCYPAVSGDDIDIDEKFIWLQNYVRTYLERDVRDLANFRELEPFVLLQRYLAQNTATLINMSETGKRIGLSVKTVQKYIRYLDISYQSITLPAWSGNLNKRLAKMPKIHMIDNGVLQAVLKKRGGLTGHEFESLIVSEIYKQIKTNDLEAIPYHLRTHDGKEIDLLLELHDCYYAVEIKLTDKTTKNDFRHLKNLDAILDKPLKKAFLISNDPETKYMSENIIAINAAMFLA